MESFAFNAQARKCDPNDAATLWNPAIAATALRDWNTAREVWRSLDILAEPGEGPIDLDRGSTNFRFGDIVLHDGAPVGYRLNADGIECPLFNVLELFEPSSFATYEATLRAASPDNFSTFGISSK